MSNQAVGNVYQIIIDDVINSSRVDFEESGIDETALEELRQGWQQKLSQLDVARFPWDPKPEQTPAPPPPAPAQPGPSHTQAKFSPSLSLPGAGATGAANGLDTAGVKQEPGLSIKQEPGTQAASIPPAYQNYNGMDNKNNVAANRAQQQLQAQYGVRAAGSINAIQDRIAQQPRTQVPLPQQPQQSPQAMAQQQQQNLQQQQQQQQQAMYRQQMAAQTQQQQQQAQQPRPVPGGAAAPHVQNGQTDGPGDVDDDEHDFEGVMLERGPGGEVNELGRVEIDRMLHDQIAAKAKSMEGGGLMLPLKEVTRNTAAASGSRPRRRRGVAAHDGADDEDEEPDELDEDAINSDLDDPDEDRDDDEVDDEGLGHIMLCLWDKVQRVKNKWKCTLKDGVLTVNGKEYVFHKATGEYEW